MEQDRYQVRFDWGVDGAAAIPADVLVWVDAIDPRAVPVDRLPSGGAVIRTGLDGAPDAAAWVLALQESRQRRTSVAVVAAGAPRGAGSRWCAEDLLAAGAVMDALEARGIDAMSPEAAAADAAYRGLAPALDSLLRAVVGAGPLATGFEVVVPHPDAAAG